MRIDSLVSAYERDRAVRFLGYHRDARHLDDAGYLQRIERARCARTSEELHALFEGLAQLTELPHDALDDLQALVDPDTARTGRPGGIFGTMRAFGSDRADAGPMMAIGLIITLCTALWMCLAAVVTLLWATTYLLFGASFSPTPFLQKSGIVLGVCAALMSVVAVVANPRR